MKTSIKLFITVTSIFMLLNSCILEAQNSITPSNNYINKSYTLEPFERIECDFVGDIIYTQSNNVSTEIYGPDNIVPLVEMRVDNNTLYISVKDQKRVRLRRANLELSISTPTIRFIKAKGVGNVKLEGQISTSQLEILSEGVGNISTKSLNCEDLKVVFKGVGNVELTGKSTNASYSLHGVGDIRAYNFKSESVDCFLTGVGNINCYAGESINADSKGVGNIKYKGNPRDKNISKSGIGSVKGVN